MPNPDSLYINFECTGCQSSIAAKSRSAGKAINCPHCNALVVVPSAESSFEPASPPPPPKLDVPAINTATPRTRPTTYRRRKKSNSTLLLGVVFGGGFLVLALLAYKFTTTKNSTKPDANNSPSLVEKTPPESETQTEKEEAEQFRPGVGIVVEAMPLEKQVELVAKYETAQKFKSGEAEWKPTRDGRSVIINKESQNHYVVMGNGTSTNTYGAKKKFVYMTKLHIETNNYDGGSYDKIKVDDVVIWEDGQMDQL